MARKGFERQGPLPTVSHFKGHGVTRLLVTCMTATASGYLCHHIGTSALDGLPDVDLLELHRRIKFRCSKCGGTNVELRPDWGSRPSDKVAAPARGWIVPP